MIKKHIRFFAVRCTVIHFQKMIKFVWNFVRTKHCNSLICCIVDVSTLRKNWIGSRLSLISADWICSAESQCRICLFFLLCSMSTPFPCILCPYFLVRVLFLQVRTFICPRPCNVLLFLANFKFNDHVWSADMTRELWWLRWNQDE